MRFPPGFDHWYWIKLWTFEILHYQTEAYLSFFFLILVFCSTTSRDGGDSASVVLAERSRIPTVLHWHPPRWANLRLRLLIPSYTYRIPWGKANQDSTIQILLWSPQVGRPWVKIISMRPCCHVPVCEAGSLLTSCLCAHRWSWRWRYLGTLPENCTRLHRPLFWLWKTDLCVLFCWHSEVAGFLVLNVGCRIKWNPSLAHSFL